MKKYKWTLLTICLTLFLFVPFALKIHNSQLEIFPSIIFPSGASVSNINDNLKTSHTYEFYGFNPEISRINKKDFFGTIPIHFSHSIISSSFGLIEIKRKIHFIINNVSFNRSNNYDSTKLKETKIWIKNRLAENDFLDSAFILRRYEIIYDIKEKKLVEENLINETIFTLY